MIVYLQQSIQYKVRAIILVAGRGSRLPKQLSKNPKSYLKLGDTTIIEKLINNFYDLGIKKVALVTGYKKNKFKKFRLKNFHNEKWKKTNMVYSLNKANSWLYKYKCIVSYGDIFYEKKIIKKLLLEKSPISIAYDPFWKKLWSKRFKNPLDDAETFKINNKNIVLEIGKKTKSINNIQGQYMGLLKFEPKGWKVFKSCLKKDYKNNYKKLYLTDILQKLIDKKISIKGIKFNGKWAEVDNGRDYKIMKEIFKV